MSSHQKLDLQHRKDFTNTEFLPEEQRFMRYLKIPKPWDLHQKDVTTICLALKTNRAYVQETQRTVGN